LPKIVPFLTPDSCFLAINQKSQIKNQKFLALNPQPIRQASTGKTRDLNSRSSRRKEAQTSFRARPCQLTHGGTANLAVLPGNLPGSRSVGHVGFGGSTRILNYRNQHNFLSHHKLGSRFFPRQSLEIERLVD
jgi:hypothetical protein